METHLIEGISTCFILFFLFVVPILPVSFSLFIYSKKDLNIIGNNIAIHIIVQEPLVYYKVNISKVN